MVASGGIGRRLKGIRYIAWATLEQQYIMLGANPSLAMKGCSQVVKAWRAHNLGKPDSEVRILPPL